MPSLERTGTTRPLGSASAAANLLAGEPAPWPRPIACSHRVRQTLPELPAYRSVGSGRRRSKISPIDERKRKTAMRAIQIARLDGPQAAEIVEIDEPIGDGE